MSTLLAVDPGIRGCGCALFEDGRLAACAYVKNPAKSGHGPRECAQVVGAIVDWLVEIQLAGVVAVLLSDRLKTLALEYPQVYQRGGDRTKGDPNVAVLPLVGVDCALAALFREAEVRYCVPHAWKGTVAKVGADGSNIIEGRVRARLGAEEVGALDAGIRGAKSLAHNVVDAVGIGLHFLGRLERRRAFARE